MEKSAHFILYRRVCLNITALNHACLLCLSTVHPMLCTQFISDHLMDYPIACPEWGYESLCCYKCFSDALLIRNGVSANVFF